MPPFCPVVKKKKYKQKEVIVPQQKEIVVTNQKEASLWDLQKQIMFLQDMIVMNGKRD